jgi:hypothetical protein
MPKEKLHTLEQTGNFLFHGSPHVLDILEPRQAQTIKDEKVGMVDDGEPAVATSPFADVAIFRALINSVNIFGNYYTSSFSYRNGALSFTTNQETLEQAKSCIGYVYVFNKSDFEKYSPMEYRSLKAVTPIEVVKVTFVDLPNNIEIE